MNIHQPVAAHEGEPLGTRPYSPLTADSLAVSGTPLLVMVGAVIRKRKWVLIGAVLTSLLIGMVLTLLVTPKYTATATLQVQREQRNFTNVEGAQRQDTAQFDQEFYQTQYGLLKSEALAMSVATTLRLQDDPAFFRKLNPALAKAWFNNTRPKSASPRDERLRAAAGLLLGNIVVEPDRNSQLVRVSFTSPDPVISQRVANAWGGQFIQSSLDRRYEATAYARNFLEQRLAQLRGRIDESERALVEYGAQQGIVTVPTIGSGGGDDATGGVGGSSRDVPLVATDLAASNAELAKANNARIIAQSRLANASESTPEALGNTAISTMRARRAEVAADYAKLLQQFDPKFPSAVALRSQLAVLDRDIAAEEKRVNASFASDYKAAAARESALQTRVAQLKQSYLDLRRRSIRYDIIQRDVDTNRQLYAALLQRFKEIGVAGGVGVNNVSVVDQADLPRVPSSPRLFVNLGVALLIGLLAGSGLVLALEQLDSGISNPVEVQSSLGLPLLGIVPKVAEEPLQALEDTKEAITEAYTSIQTTMGFATDHGFPRTLIVTSSKPGEGKSTTSYALARRLAQLGRATVLVDGDMRLRSISKALNVQNEFGLSNYLSGGAETIESLLQTIPNTGLLVIASGVTPPSTTELLAGTRLPKLIAELLTRFDHVVIDSPPVMGIADAPLLATQVEAVAFVIEAQQTTRGMARVAIGRLLSARANVIGAVLTKFDRHGPAYGYDYGYSYTYGQPSKRPNDY